VSRPLHWSPSSTDRDREEMLRVIGVHDPLELFSDVPAELLLERPPSVGFGGLLSEWELETIVEGLMERNVAYLDPPPFLGAGWCPHLVPALVDYIISRPEFMTAYTPYQPEINQGVLQALFEYQSMVADLLEMDVVNASMYDGSTALAESLLMALRVTRRRKIVVPGNMNPWYRRVVETWLGGRGVRLYVASVDGETGTVSVDVVERVVDDDTAAVYVENPSFLGTFDENIEYIGEIAHKRGALFIVGFEPLSLGIFKPPGAYGADIAVGEGQPLGLGLNYGGPGLGILAIRDDRRLLRQMPGRIVGATRDSSGNMAFTLILQAREQHIRREKATSNITTNEALMAIAAAVYLALLGGEGLRRLARSIWLRSHYLARRLSEIDGVDAPLFSSEFFKEFTAAFPCSYETIRARLKRHGILAGLALQSYGRLHGDRLLASLPRGASLFCVTELHSKRHIDRLVSLISRVVEDECRRGGMEAG